MKEDYIPQEQFNLIIEALKKEIGTTDDLMSGDFIERLWEKLRQTETV